jgi:PAS domain S-box-containing protein
MGVIAGNLSSIGWSSERGELNQERDFTRTLIDTMGEGMMVLDAEGGWEFGNRKVYEMLGYLPEELLGQSGSLCFRPPLELTATDLVRIERRHRTAVFETRMVRKDGSSFPALVSVSPRRDHRGAFLGTIVLVTDITERKQWDQQMMRSEKLAALGTLAAGVAHNLNNVLAAIVARTDLLTRQVKDPELKRWLSTIQQSALDGASTVRRLQDFARTGAPESMVAVDVHRVIGEVLQFTQARWKDEAELKGVKIEIVTDLAEVPLIAANPAELREVFTNVIFNALDAMPNGGRLTIRTRLTQNPEEEGGRRVEVVFADTGIGMREEVRQKIFDPFFTTKGVKGTGLGLSTSYGIVVRHGGTIGMESEVGHGSTFTIALPVPVELPGSVEMSSASGRRRTGRILVIDDEPHLREVVTNLLKLEGHVAVGVASGAEGVEAFRAEPFDVVITDLGMPDFTGLEVARTVRSLWPEVKVVLCTGWNVTVSEADLENCSIDRLLEKPFRLDQVLRLVHDLLGETSTPHDRWRR